MLDLPPPQVEQHMIVQQIQLINPLYFPQQRDLTTQVPSQEELFKIAENYQQCFSNGLDWSCCSKLTIDIYHYLRRFNQLSSEEIRSHVITVLDHFIDITDTPWLPDEYTDPFFKALIPPLVDMLSSSLAPIAALISPTYATPPTAARLAIFTEEFKATFADGIQLYDLPVCIHAAMKFTGSFFFINTADKKQCVIKIVDTFIDATNVPGPNFIIQPIIKRMVHPFIDTLFTYLTFL